jgi:hypothetical protein
MTSRCERSLRADARRRYADLAARSALTDTAAAGARLQAGEELAEAGEQGASSLTEQVRALYEDSVVPVRELAGIAGVSERTLYKYVQKGDWRRRYVRIARDGAVAAANRGRSHKAAPGFAPAKGAGGRFIRREDAGKPHPRGLKALDPQGAREAAAGCDRAGALAQEATAAALLRRRRVAAEKNSQAQVRAFELLAAALLDLIKRQIETESAGPPRARRLAARIGAAILRLMMWLCGNRDAGVAR